MSFPSPLSQPEHGMGALIPPSAAALTSLPTKARRTGGALIWVGGLLVILLIVLVAYFLRFLGPAASLVGVILAFLPFVAVWFAVRAVDKWEPEPRGLLVFAVAWGAIASVAIALGVDLLLTVFLGPAPEFVSAVIQAPIVEEVAKGLGIVLIYAAARRAFDGPVDGIDYGALVGAGFAYTENILYFGLQLTEEGVLTAGTIEIFVIRGLMSPFAHVMFTILIGFAFGLAARRSLSPGASLRYGIVGLAGAVMLHALWNGSAVLFDFFALYATVQVPLFVLFILGIVLLRREESRLTRARLGEYADAGWFTPQEVDMLATGPGRRAAVAWARTLQGDRGAVMRRFIADATALAAARQRALSGRDSHAVAEERDLLGRATTARAALFAPAVAASTRS